jgi:hypothetical protein
VLPSKKKTKCLVDWIIIFIFVKLIGFLCFFLFELIGFVVFCLLLSLMARTRVVHAQSMTRYRSKWRESFYRNRFNAGRLKNSGVKMKEIQRFLLIKSRSSVYHFSRRDQQRDYECRWGGVRRNQFRPEDKLEMKRILWEMAQESPESRISDYQLKLADNQFIVSKSWIQSKYFNCLL